MLSVMGAFAEFERALIRERQREGIALAKQRGAYRGRKKSLSSERIAELRQRVEAGEQKTKLAREFGISRETRHCCKVSDEAAFCLIQRPYISKTLLTRRISPRGSP